MIAAILVAAGRGSRAAPSTTSPKQYVELDGKPLLVRSLEPFLTHPDVQVVQVVIHPDDRALYEGSVPSSDKLWSPVAGGATRQESVRRGLEVLQPHKPNRVLIHDAARPFVDKATIDAVLEPLERCAGAVAATPVADTLKRQNTDTGLVETTVDRTGLWRALTPQAFRFDAIYEAHRAAARTGRTDFTDDASIAEFAGLDIALVETDARNIKITHPGDFALATQLLPRRSVDVRTGQGYDVHAFSSGDHVILCGVKIPHSHALLGHSDADVAMHALTDAILGAIGDGDIGQHFPPTDEKWRGAASEVFLQDACRRIKKAGARLTNVDVTIVCEVPKIGPHREAMRRELARLLEIDISRIGVKATTSEGLGFTGRSEGIAAHALATVVFD
ncbi:MAG: bifunctional 2-C-methyl-D-erythritol 4-phosphate cytidylyltransferase/2-C-methyl-D-erythritol 2,4-cyclodiphosphate synthase [Hyphomicrobiaceae bacterium]